MGSFIVLTRPPEVFGEMANISADCAASTDGSQMNSTSGPTIWSPLSEALQEQAASALADDSTERTPQIDQLGLPPGLIYVVLDDDSMVRLISKKDLKSVNASPDSIILGATFTEAKSASARLLDLANSHRTMTRFMRPTGVSMVAICARS